jgi:small subunit ribosomal protein S27Ae
MNASNYYKIEGNKLVRTHRTCPKCGPSFFLANHYDRQSCGNCGYTVFKRKGSAKSRGPRRSPRKRMKSREG